MVFIEQSPLVLKNNDLLSDVNSGAFRQTRCRNPSLKDLFKEIWVGPTFFWKMAEKLSKKILSECNDRDCGRLRRGGAVNFASNSRTNEEKEGKGIRNYRC